ncbi:hypothetical protein Ait01nite_010650 [Actinoplanes italicus]|uniref:Uncharacterized protein n=1 Tax=Actinoplanes italicus TaxID=113567 RepID=A0A2T0KKU8_9ACTN|nr:hypothetical protein [Actinoplanes italicus]PRX24253.1 hypothetical protein CLV67_10228 [Actinoplanes italicus]GIE28020.1 hypothetical protein Ait01nite_010650 [Actinoplanes italicus]
MNDEFPRPYADEPSPVAESLSGFRLLRVRPWAVLATVVLTTALLAAEWWRWMNSFLPYDPTDPLIVEVGHTLLDELPLAVPLVVIAALSRRRVRPLQVLALVGVMGALAMVSLELTDVVWDDIGPEYGVRVTGVDVTTYLVNAINAIVLILIGLAARFLLPAPGHRAMRSGRGMLALVVASVLWSVVTLQWMEPLRLSLWETAALASAMWATLTVVWSIAALVTSPRAVSEWTGDPAELQRQDP